MSAKNQLEDFDKLIEAFISIGNKMARTKIIQSDERLYNAEWLGKKIVHHIITFTLVSVRNKIKESLSACPHALELIN